MLDYLASAGIGYFAKKKGWKLNTAEQGSRPRMPGDRDETKELGPRRRWADPRQDGEVRYCPPVELIVDHGPGKDANRRAAVKPVRFPMGE